MSQVNTQTILSPSGAVIANPFDAFLVKGFQPVPFDQCRMVLAGLPKTGKSTLADSAGRNLTIDMSRESRGVVGMKNPPLDLCAMSTSRKTTMHDSLEQVVTWLVDNGPEKTGYQRVTFDTGGKLYSIICDQIVKEYNAGREAAKKPQARHIGEAGAEGAGWFAAANRVGGVLSMLGQAGFGWTFIVHEKLVRGDAGNYDERDLAVPQSLRSVLYAEAELIVAVERQVSNVPRMVTQTLKLPTGQTITREQQEGIDSKIEVLLNITPTFSADPKGSRYANMPRTLKLPKDSGWEVLRAAYDAANAKTALEGGAPQSKV